jgi:hypothetical protein
MRLYLSLVALCSGISAFGNPAAEFYFAYGSDQLAQLNNRLLGDRLSDTVALRVQSLGILKVQLKMRISGVSGPRRLTGFATNIAFDRSLRAEAEPWNYLDSNAFRKIAPATDNLRDSITNFQEFPAFEVDAITPQDLDNDGVQDTGRWKVTGGQGVDIFGTSGAGVTVRPVGIGASINGDNLSGDLPAILSLKNGDYHLWDYEFKNNMVAGETYGYGAGETGLWIFTNPPYGSNNSTSFVPRDGGMTFSGGRYNILAVPEPSCFVVFALAGMVLMRRRGWS